MSGGNNAVSRLIEMNKERGNLYKEASDAGNMISEPIVIYKVLHAA